MQISKNTKILFFGLGSIGKRHLRLLKKKNECFIYAYRTKKRNQIQNVENIYDINKALLIRPDIVFITNPTFLHVETALRCLKEGIKYIFIEKPLSNSLKDLEVLLKETEKARALVYVGYNLRHNPILKRLKQLFEERKNEVFFVRTHCASYLPNWRPEQDYRMVSSSKKDEGGGVILDISHEFDYNEWIFGKIKSIEGIYGKISGLEIDSEDFCDVTLKFENKKLIGKIYLDYFSHKTERWIKIISNSEEIIADLVRKEIRIISESGVQKESFNFDRDYTYEHQLNYFFKGIENDSRDINNLKDAKELLEKLLEFKQKNKKFTF